MSQPLRHLPQPRGGGRRIDLREEDGVCGPCAPFPRLVILLPCPILNRTAHLSIRMLLSKPVSVAEILLQDDGWQPTDQGQQWQRHMPFLDLGGQGGPRPRRPVHAVNDVLLVSVV